ncbi:MAG: cobalamin-dependent protein [Anaerolineales bacterium]
MEVELTELYNSILNGDGKAAPDQVNVAIEAGIAPSRILNECMITAMSEVGRMYEIGELHDIGKNLVCMMLEGAGFEITDLGADVSPEKFVEAVRTTNCDIVALSALLTTTMTNMKVTIEALKAAGLNDRVKVIVGGAPITEDYASQIGADGYAPDASRAVTLAKSLIVA